ncbi:PRD domain-containing protein [Bacillus sp. T33-2]|uniref:PRD domain-containing protein n=1 Tax=Bacillus sp. T33-2 TaxID=2054168 RepID=UPI000C78B737|nr:PRD domain-containing protein [Bacillus sp. T33-2]PLR94462.1 PRD domain-containing protein [Bacillus sp. T33-2]
MNITELRERLSLLTQSNVISHRSADLTLKAFQQMQLILGTDDIQSAEMLFTHLPCAITRIERGEDIEAPMPELLKEIPQTDYYPLVLKEIKHIESLHGYPLPDGEIGYLLIHYTNVFKQNRGGHKKI